MTNFQKFLRVLQFLRILDAQNNISITNLALIAVTVRLLMIPELNLQDLGAFFAAVVSYQIKRFAVPATAPEDTTELKAAVEKLQTHVSALQLGQQMTQRR